MNVTTLLELAKISPYLVLPVLFSIILWKIYNAQDKYMKNLMKEKSEQISEFGNKIQTLTEVLGSKFICYEKENREQHERLNEAILTRLEIISAKIDALRVEIAGWVSKK